MGAIASTQVTSLVLDAWVIGRTQNRGNKTRVGMLVKISIDGATDNAYVTGGIPLTALFTDGNASDLKLDLTQPVWSSGMVPLWKSDPGADAGVVASVPAMLRVKSGAPAASNYKLWCGKVAANDAGNTGIDEAAAADLSGTDLLGAAGTFVCYMVICGTLRQGETISGIDA